MKILNLSFYNLNSLKGTWHIDFTDSAFDDGIFAIIGQTGAGKTTILDAICLAIYGQTPRISHISNTQNELMSIDTAECSATVELMMGQKIYRFYWGQHRAGKKAHGKLQAIRREISELSYPYQTNATILENKPNLCVQKTLDIMQMTFRQFTRSVMLAQGDFNAFLKADTNEKGEILEQITGTHLYALIGTKAYQIAKQKNQQLTTLQDKLADSRAINDDEFIALKTLLTTQQQQLLDKQQTLGVLDNHIALLNHKSQQEQFIAQKHRQVSQSQQALADFAPQLARLTTANQAASIKPLYDKIQHAQKQLNEHQQTLSALHTTLPTLTKKLTQHSTQTQTLAQSLKQHKDQYAKMLPIFEQAMHLDHQIIQKQQTLEQLQQASKELHTHLSSFNQQQQALNQQKHQIQDTLEQLSHQLTNTTNIETIETDYGRLTAIQPQMDEHLQKISHLSVLCQQLNNDIDEHSKKINQIKSAQKNIEKHIQQHQQTHQEILQKLLATTHHTHITDDELLTYGLQLKETIHQHQQLHQNITSMIEKSQKKQTLQEAIWQISTDIEHNEQQKTTLKQEINTLIATINQEKQLLSTLQTNQELEKELTLLKTYLSTLQDNHPCPLCGSLEHPYKKTHHTLNITDNTQQITTLKHTIDSKKRQLQQKEHQSITVDSQLYHLNNQKIQLNNDLNELNHIQKTLLARTNQLFHPYLKNNIIDDDLTTLKSLSQSIADTLKSLQKQENDYQSYHALIIKNQEKIDTLTNQLLDMEKSHLTFDKELDFLQQKLTHQNLEITNHILKINELISNINTIVKKYQEMTLSTITINDNQLTQIKDIPKLLANLLIDIDKKNQYYKSINAQKQTHTQNLIKLKSSLLHCQQKLEETKQHIDSHQQKLIDSQKQLDELQKTRHELFANRNIKEEQTKLLTSINDTQNEYDNALVQLNRTKEELALLNQQIHQHQQSIENNRHLLEQQQQEFDHQLTQNNFAHLSEFLSSLIDDQERQHLNDTHQTLIHQLTHQQQDLEQSVLHLENFLTSNPQIAQLQLSDVIDDKNILQDDIHQLLKILGKNQQIYDEAKIDRQKHQQLIQQINQQKQDNEIWDKLDKLIGSADGKKYRNFVQGLTLQTLLFYANEILKQMSERYILSHNQHNIKDPLEISVIDAYQGNEIRSTKNLSGGESFIISLALAMGLSMMNSDKIQIDSLFLDEGFGTLDDEVLDIALSTLSLLNHHGKMIGIISHISALKESIATKIIVKKNQHGSSILTGAGVQKSKPSFITQ